MPFHPHIFRFLSSCLRCVFLSLCLVPLLLLFFFILMVTETVVAGLGKDKAKGKQYTMHRL